MPIMNHVKSRMINFYMRLMNGKISKLSFTMYRLMRKKCELENDYNPKWLDMVSSCLANIGMNDVWIMQGNGFTTDYCPACRTSLIATRFWVVVICPIIKWLTVLEYSFILFDLCLFITIFNFNLNYVPIVTCWIFTYHKIWILLIIFCFIWNYWIIYFLTCLEVFWSVVS